MSVSSLKFHSQFFLVFGLLFFWAHSALAGEATLSWSPNDEQDLGGYMIYYGTSSGSYGPPLDVGNVLTHKVTGLTEGLTYYFALSAYDTSGNESALSAEVSKLIDSSSGGDDSGGGCGRIKHISGGPGPRPGQIALTVFILALPLLLAKMMWLRRRIRGVS